jgi:hypothetical protein
MGKVIEPRRLRKALKMSLYTFFVEIEGGTYLSQIAAADENQALENWCNEFPSKRLFAHRTTRMAKAIKRTVDDLTEVSELTGVWCFTARFAGKLILGHVVRSDVVGVAAR